MENLIGFLVGWPSIAITLCLAVAGAWLARPVLLWVAVLLSAPVALYVSMTPRLAFVGIIPIGALAIAALTCRNGPKWLTIFSVGTYTVCVVALAIFVFVSEA